jgi:hypothetical protein
VSGASVKFDAPRIEVDSAVAGGPRKKRYAHADRFWAKALANYAAHTGAISTDYKAPEGDMAFVQAGGYL